jgi:hypothetical protein
MRTSFFPALLFAASVAGVSGANAQGVIVEDDAFVGPPVVGAGPIAVPGGPIVRPDVVVVHRAPVIVERAPLVVRAAPILAPGPIVVAPRVCPYGYYC